MNPRSRLLKTRIAGVSQTMYGYVDTIISFGNISILTFEPSGEQDARRRDTAGAALRRKDFAC